MRKQTFEFHSCYDELLSMLFMMNSKKTDNEKYVNVFLKSSTASTHLSAHEILLYSLLLHKCIECGSEKGTISYEELQKLRNKRCGNIKLFDEDTLNAYNDAFKGLLTKHISFNVGGKRTNVTYKSKEQPILLLYNSENLDNGNKIITYSLGPFGKTLLESKRFSTLVPNKYFQINFKEITKYELALYICRLIYINSKKRDKQLTITLSSIMKSINKYVVVDKQLTRSCSCMEYKGPNVKRLWNYVSDNVSLLLEQLKLEYKIQDYNIQDMNTDKGYSNIKWKLYLNK